MKKVLFMPYIERAQVDHEALGYTHAWTGERFMQPIQNLIHAAKEHEIEMKSVFYTGDIDADAYVFWERPLPQSKYFAYALKNRKPMYLIATEPDFMIAMNSDPANPYIFEKIFTWDSRLIDNKKFFPIRPITFAFPEVRHSVPFSEKRFCTLISSVHPRYSNELYFQRMVTIKWFEENYPEGLDWYGRTIRNSQDDSKLFRGETKDKLNVMSQYRFCICYESTSRYPGFITEKIFDAFFAGTVPVYWGPDDITEYVPENCFIDRRKFGDHSDLLAYMQGIGEEEYAEYQRNAGAFLKSDFAQSYNEWTLPRTIMSECFGHHIDYGS